MGNAKKIKETLNSEREEHLKWLQAEGVGLYESLKQEFIGQDLNGLDLDGKNFSNTNFDKSDFSSASLQGSEFFNSILTNTKWVGANLREARFHVDTYFHSTGFYKMSYNFEKKTDQVDLSNADMSDAILENAYFNQSVLCYAKFFNVKAKKTKFSSADLSDAIFKNADLTDADFSYSILMDTKFDNSTLNGVDFTGTDLRNKNFSGLKLQEAKFVNSNLNNVDFRGADLSGANFEGADLTDANFEDAILDNVNFNGANLSNVKLNNVDLAKIEFRLKEIPSKKEEDIYCGGYSYTKAQPKTIFNHETVIMGKNKEEQKSLINLYYEKYKNLRNKQSFSFFRTYYISEIEKQATDAERILLILKHIGDKPDSRTKTAWEEAFKLLKEKNNLKNQDSRALASY